MFKPRKLASKSKLSKRRRKIFLFKGSTVFLIVLLLLGISAFLLHQDKVTIHNVIVEGNSVVQNKTLQRFVLEELEGKYFFIFPKTSIFIYPKDTIENKVPDIFKRIQAAVISFEDFQTIRITVDEREPHALWCGENKIENDSAQCYFLDEKGFLYTPAPTFSGNTFFRYYGSLLNIYSNEDSSQEPAGKSLLAEAEFQKIRFFLNTLRSFNLEPVALSILDDIDMEIYLIGGEKILLGRNQNLSLVLDNIQTFFESGEYIERTEEGEVLEYVDFRFGNKAYFIFK